MNDNSTEQAAPSANSLIIKPECLRIDDEKVLNYLLNDEHPIGGSKAKFFKSIGFSDRDIDGFKSAMRRHATINPIAVKKMHDFGEKLIVDCFIEMPNTRSYCIRTVWNDHYDGQPPRLITAHPLREGASEG